MFLFLLVLLSAIYSGSSSSVLNSLVSSMSTETGNRSLKLLISSDGLIHFWPFNSSYNDMVGSVRPIHLTVNSFTQNRFNETNSAINVGPGHIALSPGVYFNSSSFTISVWLNPRKVPVGDELQLFKCGNKDDKDKKSKDADLVKLVFMSERIYLQVGDAAQSESTLVAPLNGDDLVKLNTWCQVSAVFDGSVAKIYLNGVRLIEGKVNKPTSVMRKNNVIGRSGFVSKSAVNVDIDDLRIYNKALSASEILAEASSKGQNSENFGLLESYVRLELQAVKEKLALMSLRIDNLENQQKMTSTSSPYTTSRDNNNNNNDKKTPPQRFLFASSDASTFFVNSSRSWMKYHNGTLAEMFEEHTWTSEELTLKRQDGFFYNIGRDQVFSGKKRDKLSLVIKSGRWINGVDDVDDKPVDEKHRLVFVWAAPTHTFYAKDGSKWIEYSNGSAKRTFNHISSDSKRVTMVSLDRSVYARIGNDKITWGYDPEDITEIWSKGKWIVSK